MTASHRGCRVLLLVIALGALARGVGAHERSISYSSWDIRGRSARVTVRITELELSRLPWNAGAEGPTGDYLSQRLQLLAAGEPCPMTETPRRLAAPEGRAAYEWSVSCPREGALEIRSEVLLDVAPSHMHFARVRREGAPILERVLTDAERTWMLAAGESAPAAQTLGTSLASYIELGVEHIWTGYDHLAFLLALLLIGSSIAEVARVVTGFTLAHSLTLALAVLGYVRPDTAPVEALIGLSIALVAMENIWLLSNRTWILPSIIATALVGLAAAAAYGYGRVPGVTLAGLALFSFCYFGLLRHVSRPSLLRWAVAFIFGLVHGFGFAGVLAEARLPTDRLAHALLGFNAGVEIGQLAVVALAWPLLRLAVRADDERFHGVIVEASSAAVCGLGLFWFITRAYAL